MKRKFYMITVVVFLNLIPSLFYSCDMGSVVDKYIYVYKTKADYSLNVCVELSSDKSWITGFPGPSDVSTELPVTLAEGYILDGAMGSNSGFLSITNEEYIQNYAVSPGPDSLYKLLLDKDPFLEFYEFNDKKNVFYNESGVNGVDTAFINHLIREDNLQQYFIRVK
ncbi:hypothetical protein ACFLSE_09275 [Bacteroidota bacterium]